MSTMDNDSAEQLWYTWSDVGLSTVHAGFRIRAASPGLTEIYSERVKSIDRYMRYVLPPGTDPFAITPDMAPISLAFIRTDSEYILVHKKYVGEDGVGRLGNFFVHVIAFGNFTQIFSTTDAIWLWGSDIWKTNDKGQDRRSNRLDPIPLKTLQSQIDNFKPNFAKMQQYLPFVIEAYLTRKNKSSLYIAAPADNMAMIAFLIAGIANWLPRQLVAGLTFSTYEPDVTKASTEIVGTSWIPTPEKVENAQVFSPQFYRENLAVNCYTGDRSSLQGHPQITPKPQAADFAAYMTDCLLSGSTEQLFALLELAEKSQTLDVDTFLRMYYNEIANTDSIVETDIEKYLADPYLRLDRLSNRNFRKSIIERSVANRQWSENQLQRLLLALREQAQRESATAFPLGNMQNRNIAFLAQQVQTSGSSPLALAKRSGNKATPQTKKNQLTLMETLFLLAKRAIPDIIDAMKSVGAWRETVLGQSGVDEIERRRKIEAVASLLSLIDCCLLPQDSLEVWKELFDQITSNRNTLAFLTTHWGIFPWLLEKWDNVFPLEPEYDNAIRPLLIIPWNRLGEFLNLNLRQKHKQWNIMAVERLIQDASLTPQIAQGLAQNYSTEINYLLAQLLQETDITIATSFVVRLIENNYPVISQFAALVENLLAQLVRNPQLWTDAKNLLVTLTNNSYVGTDAYLNHVEVFLDALLATNPKASIELIDILVAYRYPRKKNLVDLILKSRVATLESILPRIYRTDDQLNTFFIQYGSHYLSESDQIRAMIAFYKKLLPLPQKLERLFVLLNTPLPEKTTLDLLAITPFEGYESAYILERYGKSYLQAFKQAPHLANTVVEWYIQLVQLGYSDRYKLLCTIFTSATDPRLLEKLLSSAHLSLEESREFFRNYGSNQHNFPFFYWSETALKLFSGLAQAANTRAASGQTELAMEKMNLLFIWLQPSQSQPPLSNQIVERLLQAASLTPIEQIDFLEHYGEVYLSLYPQSLLFKEYIGAYINAFNTDSLERTETKSFFIFLTRKYQSLALDASTQESIQRWMMLDSYFTSPDATSKRLQALAGVLLRLGLPNNLAFTTKLAIAFVSCVRKSDELSDIMHFMQLAPKVQAIQLLYIIAEQVAERYRQQQNLMLLLPYLSFVPPITPEQQRHFAREFFDILLYSIDVRNLNQWRILDAQLIQQGISHEALERWHGYLQGLQLLDRLQSSEGEENGIATSAQPQLSPPVAVNDTRHPSWLPRFHFNSDTPDYREAKNALDRALGSKQVDIIASAWRQYGAIIDSTHPNHIKPPQREKIDVSCAFAQYCQDATKNPLIPFELAKNIVEISSTIAKLQLKPSIYQQDCIRNANMQIYPGGRQPYQNPERVQSGSLPRPSSLPVAGQPQGPNPIVLKSPSASGGTSRQQPPPSITKIEIDEDPKHGKKKK